MPSHNLTIKIPDWLAFSELNLALEIDGRISFDWQVVEKICDENNIDAELFKYGSENVICELLLQWYLNQLKLGGTRDSVADSIVNQTMAEMEAGQYFSFQPGNA